jgi:hypothetical protein
MKVRIPLKLTPESESNSMTKMKVLLRKDGLKSIAKDQFEKGFPILSENRHPPKVVRSKIKEKRIGEQENEFLEEKERKHGSVTSKR